MTISHLRVTHLIQEHSAVVPTSNKTSATQYQPNTLNGLPGSQGDSINIHALCMSVWVFLYVNTFAISIFSGGFGSASSSVLRGAQPSDKTL